MAIFSGTEPSDRRRGESSGRAWRLGAALLLLCVLLSQGCTLKRSDSSPTGGGRSSGNAIAKTALSKVGTRYKMGGASPSSGFDCSGLVLWSYRQNGVQVPRTAREQIGTGRAVNKSQMRPGDIVAFRISRRAGYHTGIYTGNGKFVHSPSSGKNVREDRLDTPYWKNRFISGRRVAALE